MMTSFAWMDVELCVKGRRRGDRGIRTPFTSIISGPIVRKLSALGVLAIARS